MAWTLQISSQGAELVHMIMWQVDTWTTQLQLHWWAAMPCDKCICENMKRKSNSTAPYKMQGKKFNQTTVSKHSANRKVTDPWFCGLWHEVQTSEVEVRVGDWCSRRRWPDASIGKLDWTCFSQSLYNDIDLFWGSHKTNRSKPDLGKQQSGTNQLTSSALKVQTVDMHTSKLLQCTTAQLTHYFFDSQCFDLKSALSVQLSVHKWLARPLD